MNREERNEKIELYGHGYDMLIETLKEVPQEMWKFKPEPKEWSVHEVLVHLADSESNAASSISLKILNLSSGFSVAASMTKLPSFIVSMFPTN